MTIKEKPLAAGQADQQGAAINCLQNTLSSPSGQGEVPYGNSWRVCHTPITDKRFRSEYNGCQSYSIKFCIVRGFLILHGRKLGIALGEVRA
jgi:hypothetical protein